MTAEQRIEQMTGCEYMAEVHRLSCLCCRIRGIDGTPAQAHHPRKHGGLRDLLDKWTIPVCKWHHTDAPDSIHSQRAHVERNYGITEEEMSTRTRSDVIALLRCNVRYGSAA